jgi:hypothetical protein
MYRIRRILLSLVCGGWAFIGAAAGLEALEPQMPGTPSPDFIRFFDTLALTADYGPFNNRPPWVRKWEGPVEIVLEAPAERLRAKIEKLAARITAWTDLPFVVMPPGTVADPGSRNVIAVQLLSRDSFVNAYNTREVVCQTETHGVGGMLQVGYMVLSEGFTDCLRHEFMHALGFDSHWYPQHASEIKSVLAYRESAARAEDYSHWDIMAIRLLYDGRIRAGMNRQKSLSIAHEVIGQRPQSASLPVVREAGAVYR